MHILSALQVLLGALIIIALLLGVWRTYKTEHSANQALFESGTADNSTLDGDFQGSVTGYTGSWQGKTFNRAEASGINRFKEENGEIVTKYPFQVHAGKGLRDKNLEVIQLDYNQPGNPWWLTYLIDEMVKVGPDTYLGKVHLRLASFLTFSLGYFTLTK